MASGGTTLNKMRTNEKIPQLYLDSQDAGRKAYVLDLIDVDGMYYAGFKANEQMTCLLGDDDLVACYLAGCIFRSVRESEIYYVRAVDMTDFRNDASDPGVILHLIDSNPIFKVEDKPYSTLTYMVVCGYQDGRVSK